MKFVKCIIILFMFFIYICCLGSLSLSVTFPDNTEVSYNGWLI